MNSKTDDKKSQKLQQKPQQQIEIITKVDKKSQLQQSNTSENATGSQIQESLIQEANKQIRKQKNPKHNST